jgi:predicted ATP-grasp superfamily ATP-dependent carboligase
MEDQFLRLNEMPTLHKPHLIAAFAGWPDAGEIATGALRYTVSKYRCSRLGAISNDPFFDFSNLRPMTLVEEGELKSLHFPANDLYYRVDETADNDFIFLIGTEPHLRWELYTNLVMELVDKFRVERVVILGSMFDSVPHTRDARVSGVANTIALRRSLRINGVNAIDYQGPASYQNMIQSACDERGLDTIAFWAHTPVYVRAPSNPKACWALLNQLKQVSPLNIDLTDLHAAGDYLTDTLNRLMGENMAIRAYVKQLEELYDGVGQNQTVDEESTDQIIHDVEEFLRQEHHRREEFQGE